MELRSRMVLNLPLIVLFAMGTSPPAPALRPDAATHHDAIVDDPPSVPDPVPTDSIPHPWLYFDIMGGAQILGEAWEPYSPALNIAASCLRRLNHSSIWIDGSFSFGRGNDADGNGLRYGPGTSLVQFQAGLGRVWSSYDDPIAFFAAGGLTYVWADMWLPETFGGPPFPAVYTVSDAGHFFGGYARTGVMYQLGTEIYLGVGLVGKLTSNQDILGRDLNINSIGIGVSIGARN